MRGLLVLSAVLAALPLAEFALRLGPAPTPAPVVDEPTETLWVDDDWRTTPPKVFQADAMLGYTYAPSARADIRVAEHRGGAFRFLTNGYGLRRDDEIVMPKPAGTYRVLVLGDSQTSGYAANDETYPGHLEALVRAGAGGQSVEVLNAGVDGYSPQQAYLWLRTRGTPLQPDLIIFAVYTGNDINDLMHHGVDAATIDDAAGLVSAFRTPLTWLGLHSELVRRVGPVADAALTDTLTDLGVIEPDAPLVPQDALVRLLRECHGCWLQSVKQAVRARTEPADADTAYRRLTTLFGLLKRYAAEQDAAVAVLMIPTKTQVEPQDERGALGRAARLLMLTPEDLAYDTVAYERILAAAAAADITTIDPLSELREAARSQRLYYRRDWHLNPDGNEALATALHRALAADSALLP